jgi:heme-degrading monooxygenase HmoA
MRTYPHPPCYVVVFTSRRTPGDNGYSDSAARLDELAAQQPGYLGHESARSSPELGITVSYWKDEDSISAWKRHIEHTPIRNRGRAEWYETYEVHVAKVERSCFFERDQVDALPVDG